MTTTAPVSFEIEIRTSPAKSEPAVALRLQQAAEAASAPSLEDIVQKHQRAEARQELARTQRRGRTDEKVTEVRWRKQTLEATQLKKYKQTLLKIESAQEKREQAIATKVEAAKRSSCVLVIERKNTELEKKKAEIESKLKIAEQHRQENLDGKVLTAQKNTSKRQKAATKKAEQAQEVAHKMKASLESKERNFKKSQDMQAQVAQKAKQHGMKVEKAISAQKERDTKEL